MIIHKYNNVYRYNILHLKYYINHLHIYTHREIIKNDFILVNGPFFM